MSARRNLGANTHEAKELLRRAAERCVERYGIRKTTMDDIAREAGVSRPSLYRYYSDRDELFLTVIAQRSRALIERAHRFIASQASFEDGLVEGLLYIADHGRRDPFLRHLAASDDSHYSQRLLTDRNAAGEFAKEFWEPLVRAAESRGEVPPGFDAEDGYPWLAHLGLLLMSLMDIYSHSELRTMLRSFVLPAFIDPDRRRGPTFDVSIDSDPDEALAEPGFSNHFGLRQERNGRYGSH